MLDTRPGALRQTFVKEQCLCCAYLLQQCLVQRSGAGQLFLKQCTPFEEDEGASGCNDCFLRLFEQKVAKGSADSVRRILLQVDSQA